MPTSSNFRHIELAADTRSAASARAFVRDTLSDWGFQRVEPEASLAVSELVTNAVVHAESAPSVTLVNLGGSIRIKVRDSEPGLPRVEHPRQTDTHGRGMVMVEALSSSWGVEIAPPGKIVWLDISDH